MDEYTCMQHVWVRMCLCEVINIHEYQRIYNLDIYLHKKHSDEDKKLDR